MSEQKIQEYIENLPGYEHGIAIELGANHGMFTDSIAKKFQKCYAFECDPVNMEILKQNCKQENIVYMPQAVGLTNGTAKLYKCPSNMGGHSTCESHPQFGGWGHSFDNYIQVPSMTLDRFAELYATENNIKFIKCDIEGAEKFVFDKATTMLKNNQLTMILEVHRTVDIERLFDFFMDLGYCCYYVDTFKRADLFGYDIHYILTNDDDVIEELESVQEKLV